MRKTLMCLALFAISASALNAATVTNGIEYVTRPSGALLLDASIPDGPGPFAAVIIVHGGGFARGNKVTYVPPIFQPLTRGGFAWFTIDYRLAPSAAAKDQIDDVLSALTWVHEHAAHYKLDPKRIALLGESAGAYLVDCVAMVAPQNAPIAAVVSFYGPADFTFDSGTTKLPAAMRPFFGITPQTTDVEAQLRSISPYFMVHPGLPPFLLLHGTADEQVPYQQSPRFCQALKAKGNQCELYTVPGARHGMGQWEENTGQLEYKQKVVDWLKETLH
jgi:alpha-L-fucosidase 2